MDVLQKYLDYQVFMVQLAHAHAVDTRPFLPRRKGPGDEPRGWQVQFIDLRLESWLIDNNT